MMQLNPIQLLNAGAEEEKLENARMSSFIGAIAIGELIKSTLGPKGMDKILQPMGKSEEITVTNDGATILKSLGIDNSAAKVLIDISKVQDDEVGDGTTSVVVFACELLKEAELLIEQKIHPQIIISGWRMATAVAIKALQQSTLNHREDATLFRNDLIKIAKTTLSSKIVSQYSDLFANLAVNAILRLKEKNSSLDAIQIIKIAGGGLQDSYLDEGFLLIKKIGINQPKKIKNAKILIANTPMDADKIKIYAARVRVDGVAKVSDLELAEKEKMKQKVDKILKHECNVFINRQLIYNYPEQLFADAGVMSIEHADFEGVEALALVTGGEIVSTFDMPNSVKLGYCELIEEVMIGEEKLIKFSGVKLGESCTIVIRGATKQILDEAERSLHDALCVMYQAMKDSNTVYGGGASEMLMADAVTKVAMETTGKELLAMLSYAKALRMLPTYISDNGGYDSPALITQLIAKHNANEHTAGLNMKIGEVGDMSELGILESYQVKKQMIQSGSEAAEMIIRVDNILKAAPRKRERDNHPC